MQKQSKSITLTKKLTESAIMLALTVILSYFKLIDLPYGGSVTLCSMLPTVLIAYRHGMAWGFGVGVANGALQLLMGMSSLAYATSATAAIAIVMLDYILAFSVTGLAGIFRKLINNQTASIVSGTALVCILRYVLHVISGCTVWAGLSIPDYDALVFSLAYNATYMLPELLIAVAGAAYLSSAIGFDGDNLTRISSGKRSKGRFILTAIGALGALGAFIADVIIIAPTLQNAESGNFDITGLANVDFLTVGIITVAGTIWLALFYLIAGRKSEK